MSDIIKMFVEKAVLAGAEVVAVDSAADAAARLEHLVRENGRGNVLVSADVAADSRFAAAVVGLPPRLPPGTLWIGAGIAAAHFGLAETGTLVRFDESDEAKNVWTLPDICLALIDDGRIVGKLEDLAPEIVGHLARLDIPSPQVSLITGPSRTADIESQLTIGVHGPRRLVIVLFGTSAENGKYGDTSLICTQKRTDK